MHESEHQPAALNRHVVLLFVTHEATDPLVVAWEDDDFPRRPVTFASAHSLAAVVTPNGHPSTNRAFEFDRHFVFRPCSVEAEPTRLGEIELLLWPRQVLTERDELRVEGSLQIGRFRRVAHSPDPYSASLSSGVRTGIFNISNTSASCSSGMMSLHSDLKRQGVRPFR